MPAEGAREVLYRVTKSRRKTMGITIDRDANVQVRIPLWVSYAAAKRFTEEREDWIVRNLRKMEERISAQEGRDWDALRAETYPWIRGYGGKLLQQKIAAWAEVMGVSYHRITIKDVYSRWGSCSAKKNLNFCWRIFILPEALADYLIVHELSHLKHMDHSPAFWALVGQYIPDYKKRQKELRNYQ